MRTSTIVADTLVKLGYDIKIGRQVMNPDFTWVNLLMKKLKHITNGLKKMVQFSNISIRCPKVTGIVATLDTGREGPTAAFRVDMDALPIYESEDSSHVPLKRVSAQ